MKQKDKEMGRDDFEILDQQEVYKGYFSITKYQIRFRLFEGGWSGPVLREVFERGRVAAAILFDPVLEQVVLIEQFRIGALKQNGTPWLLEIIAGVLEEGEDPEQLIKREIDEETGCSISNLIPICDYWSSPGCTSERVALFCARVDASQAGGIHGLATEHENIRVKVVDVHEAFDAVNNGKINNSASIIALQWLQLNYEQVKQAWMNEQK